jgi:hypothetical protein
MYLEILLMDVRIRSLKITIHQRQMTMEIVFTMKSYLKLFPLVVLTLRLKIMTLLQLKTTEAVPMMISAMEWK